MAEKIFNTRIQLKYDTYADWTTANTLLKEGEVAIVEIPGSSYTKHEGDKAVVVQNPPHVLFKVGPGYFNDLDWTSAKAADVYAWAKAKTVVYEGQHIKFKGAANEDLLDLNLEEFVTATELEGILGDYYTKTEVNNTIANYYTKTEVNNITGDLSGLNTENKTNLVQAINEALQAVEVGGTGSVVTVVKETTPTTGSGATYTIKQGGNAVGDKIEIPDVKAVVDEALAEVSGTDAIEGITTLVEYVNAHGGDLAAITKEIYGDAGKIGDDPSRIDTAVANAATAVSTANGAAAVAGEAKTAAEGAVATANTASQTANEAKEAATGAVASAKSYAEAAEGHANTASAKAGEAEGARAAAVAAQGAAEGARDAAVVAKGEAVAAQQAAISAKNAAVTAQGAAETAQGKAEEAQGKAETAQGAAEDAQEAAEAAQGKAEAAQQAAESAKAAAATSESNAAKSATDAANAKTAAEAAKGAAITAQTEAGKSQTAAANSASAAATSETNAGKSATAAAGSASTATQKAADADASAKAAAASATTAGEKAEAAAASASAADSAKGAAVAAQGKAEAAQAAAEKAKADAEASNTSATAIANAAKEEAEAATAASNAATEAVGKLHAVATSGSYRDLKEVPIWLESDTISVYHDFATDSDPNTNDEYTFSVKEGSITAEHLAESYEQAGTARNLIDALDSSVAATAEANNQISVLTGITQTDGKLTAKTEAKLAAVAKTGNVNDLIQTTGDVIIFNCGTATTVI